MAESDDLVPKEPPGALRRLMQGLSHLMPADERGENPSAVRMFRRVDALRDGIARLRGRPAWPVTSGSYALGQAGAPVAICVLTSNDLVMVMSQLDGVAIAGSVVTPNLGIEKIIKNMTTNPSIRFLVLCGKESAVFKPAQALQSLFEKGVDGDRRIIGAQGHLPILSNVAHARIATFRTQVELVDRVGETSIDIIRAVVNDRVAHNPGPFAGQISGDALLDKGALESPDAGFMSIRPGGQRQPLQYDPKGYFVITVDRSPGEIELRHYAGDNSPRHIMRGHNAEAMLLGLIRDDLISQFSHAGYLGAELAKAEAALKLGLTYEQDKPLRKPASNQNQS